MKHLLVSIAFLTLSTTLFAQSVGIGTSSPDSSALLDISSTEKGLLIPRMSSTNRQSIADPAKGLMVYDTTTKAFYYFAGNGWLELLSDHVDHLEDADGDTKIEVEQSPDEDVIRMSLAGEESLIITKTDSGYTQIDLPNNSNNIFIGTDSGQNTTTGLNNIAIGHSSQAGLSTGNHNTALGYEALRGVDAGGQNTAVGYRAMLNANGSLNTALGTSALMSVSGTGNVGVGYLSSGDLTSGSDNVAVGRAALRNNISGSGNVALGTLAGAFETGNNTLYIANSGADSSEALIYGEFDNEWLRVNGRLTPTEGISDADGDTKIQVEETMDEDTIRFDLGGVESFVFGTSRINIKSTTSSLYLGDNAGSANTTGNQNTLVGYHSGRQLTSGGFNVAVGSGAMPLNTIGGANVAVGAASLSASLDGIRNTAVGYQALRASSGGDENTAVGFRAGDANNGSFNIFLGNKAGFNELGSHKLYIESTDADSNNALIYGEFDNNLLQINGTAKVNGIAYVTNKLGVGVANPNEKFEVYPNTFTDGIIGYSRIGTSSDVSDGIATFSHKNADFPAIRQFEDGVTMLGASTEQGIYFRIGTEYFGSLRDDVSVNAALVGWNFNYPAIVNYYAMKVKNDNTSSGMDTDPFHGLSIQAGRNVNNGANSNMIGFYRPDGSEIGKVVQNNSTSVNYSTSSDMRLKTSIQPTHFSIDDLMLIEVRDYVYRDEPNDPQVGFIAQQLYEHYPLAVTPGGEDAKTNPWMVDYGKLTPLIVKAVQDQQQQIDLLMEQNALLLQEIAHLKNK